MNQHIQVIMKLNIKKQLPKIIMVLLWGLFLLINTWTTNLELLLQFQSIKFKWNPAPNFLSFFYFNDFALIHQYFIIVKLGHFVGFAFIDLLIFNLIRSHKASIGISVVFAFFTEFLQLFWGRDGRLYDLVIDTFGILTVYLVSKKLKRTDNGH